MLKFRKISWEDSSQNLKTLFCFLKPQKKILPQKAESILQLYFKLHALTFRETWKTWFGPILGLFRDVLSRKLQNKTFFPKRVFSYISPEANTNTKTKPHSYFFFIHLGTDFQQEQQKIASLLNHILLKSQFVIYKIT